MKELPRYTSHTVLMHVSQFASAYHSLVQSMTASTARADIEAVIAEHAAEFTQVSSSFPSLLLFIFSHQIA
jgi:hypothetical protein